MDLHSIVLLAPAIAEWHRTLLHGTGVALAFRPTTACGTLALALSAAAAIRTGTALLAGTCRAIARRTTAAGSRPTFAR